MTPTTVYAGTDRGVFRSTDAGDTWNTFNTGLANLGVSAVAMGAGQISALGVVPSPLTPTLFHAEKTGGRGQRSLRIHFGLVAALPR
jgi:hypothetical protein